MTCTLKEKVAKDRGKICHTTLRMEAEKLAGVSKAKHLLIDNQLVWDQAAIN